MAAITSAWPTHPDYRIDLVPLTTTAEVWYGDLLLARSDRCLRVEETRHVDRLYVPASDVRWELFSAAEGVHTVCPFKGQADYWDLTAVDPPERELIWAYPEPFDEVVGLRDHVCFYQDRTRIEMDEPWPGDPPGRLRSRRFPAWGDQAELVRLMDVEAAGDGRFVGPAHGETARNVVEAGQLLGSAIVAAAKSVPGQRVVSAYLSFARAASFDRPLDLRAEVLHRGGSFSTVDVRIAQDATLRAAGTLLVGAEADELIRGAASMPAVPGPLEAVALDMGVVGRELRVVDDAYRPDPDRVGPPEILTWCRFRDDPGAAHLHSALLAQSATHWTIAAAMRPHPGIGEADAHRSVSSGVMSCAISLHDEVDVRDWLLYVTRATYAGRGLAHGEGRVHAEDGRLVASYSCDVMIRRFMRTPEELGKSYRSVM